MDPVVEQPVQTEKPKQTASAASSLFDPPNEKYEKKLHDISRNYNPVEDPHWDEIIGERRAEIYPAQPGDTLWDISETFFGDGAFWAKLWSQNGAIGNPHNIKKGKALRFAAGTEAEAPAIGVMDLNGAANSSGGLYHESFGERPTYRDEVEGQVTQAEIEGGVVLETQEIIPAPELPPPSKRVPLLKNLPKSFRENHPAYLEGFDLTGIKGAPAIRARVPATQILNSYAVDEKPESIGKIDEIETQDDFASNGQHVLVRLENPIAMGSRLTFIKLRGRPSGAPGPIVDVLGVGTVTGSIDESRHVYRAVVTTSLAPVEKGALILDEAPPKVKVSFVGPRSESRVTVLGGEFDNGRQILGMGSIIYLNGGQKAGLRVGDILGVHSMRENRKRSTRYGDDEKPIATIRIADVREKVATAIILDSFDTVVVGDITGGETPEDASELRAESVEEATAFGKPKAKPSDRGSDAL